MTTCCIGSHSYQLVPANTTDDAADAAPTPMPQSWIRPNHDANNAVISTTASALEDIISAHLSHYEHRATDTIEEEAEEGLDDDPIQIYDSHDARMLRCRPLVTKDGEGPADSIFGIIETAPSLGRAVSSDSDLPVCVSVLEPLQKHPPAKEGCSCQHPRETWIRQKLTESGNAKSNDPKDSTPGNSQSSISSYHANVKIIDLRTFQADRRSNVNTDDEYPCFDTPGKVFHLLRSVLNGKGGLHSASPWNDIYCKSNADESDCVGEDDAADQVVALLVNDPHQKHTINESYQFWEVVEQSEIDELLDFRVGDAAPSHFLHSTAQVSWGDQSNLMSMLQDLRLIEREEKSDGSSCSSTSLSNAMLFVYRRLLPRDILARNHPLGHEEKYEGCLLETYLEEPKEESELDSCLAAPAQTKPVMKQRIVSPPYQSHLQDFPGLLDTLLKGIDIIRDEAQKIPQWTAWPEQNHYAGNSWNVFPLCYTFPADDVTQRKFIHKTCSFVPGTTKLLQTLGPTLRTALFSRLDPRAKLGAHTGWADLANHVLRVHIPLIVPGSKHAKAKNNNKQADADFNTGLCGTWVDGIVETHVEGRVICFDDSKIHRAFNYSEEDRIVLIVDLLRPKGLPMGTATGGHSDELDAFINGI